MSDPGSPDSRDQHSSHAPGGKFDAPPWLGKRTQSGIVGWIAMAVFLLLVGLLVWWVVANKAADKADQGGGFGPPGMGGPGGGGSGGGRRGKGGPPAVVNTAKAEAGEMPVVVTALGTVTPAATVTLRPQLSGQLMSIGFTEGQTVKKGQFIAQIDPRPYQQQLAQVQGTLAKDEAQLANARADLKRYQTLFSQDAAPRQQMDTQAALVRQLEAQVKADEAAVGTQKLNLTYARITAPVAGRVGLRQVDVGNYVTPGDANGIVTIAQVAPIDVAFTLPEDSLPKVNSQLNHHVSMSVEVYDRSQTLLLASGKLATLDNLIDTTTGTVRAKARFANVDGALFPNQFVNVRLTVEVLKNAVIVPTSAVLRGQQGMFVYAVDAAKAVHIRPVQPGPAQGERTAILSGLSAGETVVIDGADRLREGMTVMTPGACPPGGGWGGGRKGGAGGGAGAGGFGGKRPGGGSPGCRPTGPGAPGSAASGPAASGQAPAAQPPEGARPMSGGRRPADAQASAPPAAADVGASQAGGYGQGGANGQGGGGGRMQAMLAELNLDAQQQARADALFAEARQKAMASLGDGADPDARRNAFRAAMGEAIAKLGPILRPDQKAKLAEIRARMAEGRGQGGGPQR